MRVYVLWERPPADSSADITAAPVIPLAGSHYSASGEGPPAVRWERPPGGLASPFWYAHLPSDAVVQSIAQRSLLVKVGN